MPELPEVETVKRGLEKFVIGLSVRQVSSDNVKSFPNNEDEIKQFLLGASITKVSRRAKLIIIELSTNYSLIIHLKMTGQLVFVGIDKHKSNDNTIRFGGGHPTKSLIKELPDKSTRVILTLKSTENNVNVGILYFNDQRKFGWMRLLPTSAIKELQFYKKYGPEPLENGFTAEILKQRLRSRLRSAIKAVLLDQSVIAGLGNIYVDESLWLANIHPLKPVYLLNDQEITFLHRAIQEVLSDSIAKGGSTDRNYIDVEGKVGQYLLTAKVFRRQGKPCYRCDQLIVKLKVASRGTHICPSCQTYIAEVPNR